MTDLDIVTQKLVPIDKKTVVIDEIEFDDLTVENLEDIKKEIDCAIQFRKLISDSKVSLCRKYIRSKNKLKEAFEKDKSVLQQQHDNLKLQLNVNIQNLEAKRLKANQIRANNKVKELSKELSVEEISYDEDDEEVSEEVPQPKKKIVAKGKKKVATNTKKTK